MHYQIFISYRRVLCELYKKSYLSHHIPICYSLKLLSLEDLYNVKALSFFYDFYHGNLPPYFSNFLSLFFSKNNEIMIRTKYRRTDIAACLISNTLPNIWNPLPSEVKTDLFKSKHIFLYRVKQYFVEKYKSWTCKYSNCHSCRSTSP